MKRLISTALEYAKRLRELNIPGDIVGQTGDIFKAVPQVKLDFESPAVSLSAKHNVIEKVFPLQIRDFLKVLCDNGDVCGMISAPHTEKSLPRKRKSSL